MKFPAPFVVLACMAAAPFLASVHADGPVTALAYNPEAEVLLRAAQDGDLNRVEPLMSVGAPIEG
jgi:hypothetical protein